MRNEESATGTTVNDLLYRLLGELAAEGIPDSLSTPFTLATIRLDTCSLAGEEPLVVVAAPLDEAWVAPAAD